MTERGGAALSRTDDTLSIGPSRLIWDKGALTVSFNEVCAPLPRRVRGTVRLHPAAVTRTPFQLDAGGRHIWRPIAPRARVEVSLEEPACAWTGNGYFDMNVGDEPLERAFASWSWSRAHRSSDTLIFYDVTRRDGAPAQIALRIGPDGGMESIAPPPIAALPSTGWGVSRATRGEPAEPPRLVRTLEDTPFYSRSVLAGRYGGESAEIVHEGLSLDRLRSPVVRAMLPFRMPRVFG
jgi:carotenoid 1,2-hydratase